MRQFLPKFFFSHNFYCILNNLQQHILFLGGGRWGGVTNRVLFSLFLFPFQFCDIKNVGKIFPKKREKLVTLKKVCIFLTNWDHLIFWGEFFCYSATKKKEIECNSYKGFFCEEMCQNSPDFEDKKFLKLLYLNNGFQQVTKIQQDTLKNLGTYSQIWQNY